MGAASNACHIRKRALLTAAAAGALGFSTNAGAQQAAAVDRFSPSATATEIGEIVVTANRRAESVQDVPLAITAVTGETAREQGITDYESLVRTVPGVIATGEAGFDKLTMRGIQTSQTTSGNGSQKSVSIYVDDLPVTTFSVVTADVTPFDIERIEVLRGPQGTLFGSGSLAGAVRYITNKPDSGGYDAALSLEGAVSRNKSYRRRLNGMLNLPLAEDRLAARAAGYYRNDDGYVENVGTGQKNSNTHEAWGVRGALLWRPTDSFSATLAGSYNRAVAGDGALYDPALGVNKSKSDVPFESTIDLKTLNLTVDADLGFADLTSSSTVAQSPNDWTLALPAIVPGIPYHIRSVAETKTVTQEVRLVSKPSERLDWVLGAFYLRQDTDDQTVLYFSTPFVSALNITGLPTNLAPGSADSNDVGKRENRELAAFGEANYQLTQHLKVTVGARVTNQKYTAITTGGFTAPTSFLAIFTGGNRDIPLVPRPTGAFTTGHVVKVTPKFSVTYQPNGDQTYYLTAAKGFRRGQPNGLESLNGGRSVVDPTDPAIVPPFAVGDELWNYEAGMKALWFDNRLKTNLAFYYVDWRNMQVPLIRTSDQHPYAGNIGRARSIGVEGELEARPTKNLDLGLNFTFQDAKITSITDQEALISGAELGSKLSSPARALSGYAKYTWSLAESDLYLRLDAQYVGAYPNAFPNTAGTRRLSPTFASIPAYAKADLSAGWTKDRFGAVFYVENLFDTDDVIFINPANFTANRYKTLRPRTVGVRLSWEH
ncbi:TonB-dependent receptor [Phenylobacterium sp.]|uniref:TonB-dependent receptor n=1 Tax=Phenylobacterium sp. TaxID=1871053 RepID=UPI00301E3006